MPRITDEDAKNSLPFVGESQGLSPVSFFLRFLRPQDEPVNLHQPFQPANKPISSAFDLSSISIEREETTGGKI